MKILVINCGSSSIKYQLLEMTDAEHYSLLAKGNLEKISLPDSKLTHKPAGKDAVVIMRPVPDHTLGMKLVLDALTNPETGVIGSFDASIDLTLTPYEYEVPMSPKKNAPSHVK